MAEPPRLEPVKLVEPAPLVRQAGIDLDGP
jgi:hypothetical protein